MKHLILILFLFIFFVSCGTTGHVQFCNFSASKPKVESELRFIIDEDSMHSVPIKWADIYKDPGPIEYIYLYFSKFPEEMYEVGFTEDNTEWANSPVCKSGLVGAFNGDHWNFEKDLNYREIKRIRERFEKEILSKMKYAYYKSD